MKEKIINFVLSFIAFLVLWIGLGSIWGIFVGTGVFSILYDNPLFYNQENFSTYGSIIFLILSIVILVFFREKLLYYKNEKGKMKI